MSRRHAARPTAQVDALADCGPPRRGDPAFLLMLILGYFFGLTGWLIVYAKLLMDICAVPLF